MTVQWLSLLVASATFARDLPLDDEKTTIVIFLINFIPPQVIVERFDQELSLPHLHKSKFLVPQELSMSQLITVVRYFLLIFLGIFSLTNLLFVCLATD